MHSYRRVAAVVIAAGLLATAGCWNPAPEKYPSITFFGADYGTITAGGSVTLTWQTRLAEKVNIIAIDGAGNQTTVKTFASGDTTGCTVNPAFPDSDCVKDGTLQVSPTADTTYNIEAIVGAGDCSRDPILGNLLHPTECNDLTADPNASLTVIPVSVVPASTISLTVGGNATTTVASGTDVVADYTVTGATGFDFGVVGTDGSGNTTFDYCGADGDTTVPCWYESVDANGNPNETGTIKVPGVTATTVLSGESTNGADDGAGDVASGSPGSTVTINIAAASNPQITAVTIDGNDALGTTPATATADTAALAWTANADATGGTLMTAPATAAATAGDCTTVPTASWTAASGFSFATSPYTLTGLTEDTCLQLTATGSGTATDVKTFLVLRQVNINTVTANGSDALGTTPVSAGATNPPVIAWTTSNAGSYSLAMVPMTAADCATQDYTGATPVTGTTGDGSYTPSAAITAATCFQLTVTHPSDNTRTAMVTFEVDP